MCIYSLINITQFDLYSVILFCCFHVLAVKIFGSMKIANFGGLFSPIVHLFCLGSNRFCQGKCFYLLIHVSFGWSSYGLIWHFSVDHLIKCILLTAVAMKTEKIFPKKTARNSVKRSRIFRNYCQAVLS